MNDLQKLVAIEQIKVLKARYFRSVDLKDWTLARSVFADDVVCDFRGAAVDPTTGFNALPDALESVLSGKEETLAAFEAVAPYFYSAHHGHDPEITITAEDSATGIWALFDTLRFHEGAVRDMTGYGHYYDTYELVAGEWKIKSSRLVRVRVDVVMR